MSRQWPMKQGTYQISSGFGPRWGTFHSGLDFAATDGTPFYTCAGGTVKFIGPADGYGQWIVIDHPDSEGGGCTEYGHMWDAFATGLQVGDWVDAGQIIGYVGSNGQSTGPHLHLTVWEHGYGGRRIDPEEWLRGCPHPGQPAHDEAPLPNGGVLFGVDVSEHQNGLSLARARDEGISFAILRLCDGTHVDKTFRSHLEDAESAGLLVSTYWYLRAPSEGTTIAQQVDVIDQQMGGRRDLPVWIDVESVDKDLPEDDPRRYLLTGADVWEAKRELERRGYHVPGIYSGAWYWERMPGGEPSMDGLGALWVSHYGTNKGGAPAAHYAADEGDNHPGWRYPLGDRLPDLLQFGSRGHVAGFTEVDINAFRGTLDQLRHLFHGQGTGPAESENDMLRPDERAALNECKLMLQELTSERESFINPAVRFRTRPLLGVIDATGFAILALLKGMAKKMGLNPDQIIADAIQADKEAKK
ncbi:peptidoglycan DD-metalloendopeptidase family protein [Staphylococcus chromogenes]|nr:peptidoglycan DD-metalloendopeptidase family protein [Staphylococcus chromogenes]